MKKDRISILLLFAMLFVAGIGDTKVEHGINFWVFTVVTWLLLHSIAVAGFSWFYIFMAFFFFLGCWLKIVIHHIFNYAYIEPTGGFSGEAAEWNRYYLISISIALALISARYLYVLVFRRLGGNSGSWYEFRSVHRLEWIVLIGLLIVFYKLNNLFSIFVTGVNPKIILPFGLNAPLAFMASAGFAILVSIYISRDFLSNGRLTTRAVIVMLFFGFLASISMASRAAIVIQVLPVLLAASYLQIKDKRDISLKPFFIFAIIFGFALVLVSLYRINVYMSESVYDKDLIVHYISETFGLVIDRWIGAEAIMVAVSEPDASLALMMKLLVEDPRVGSDAIYQVLSGEKYEASEIFTFLTLPGYVGVLALSGSVVATFIGGIVIMFLGLVFERFIRWATLRQTICVAVVCSLLANSLVQLSFPKLFLAFIFQLVVFLFIIRFAIKSFFVQEKFS